MGLYSKYTRPLTSEIVFPPRGHRRGGACIALPTAAVCRGSGKMVRLECVLSLECVLYLECVLPGVCRGSRINHVCGLELRNCPLQFVQSTTMSNMK